MVASNIVVEWMKQNTSFNSTGDNILPSLTTDKDGNILFTYVTDGTTSGNSSSGNSDIVICKMNASGEVLWIKQDGRFNTIYSEFIPKITTDSANNVYVCYITNGILSGGGQIPYNVIVIIKLNSNGQVQWVNQTDDVNTSDDNEFPSIAVDTQQNIYLAYSGAGTASGNTSVGNYDTIIAKLDVTGNLLWVEQRSDINVLSNDFRQEIHMCNNDRYFYLTFYSNIGTVPPGRDIKIVKYDTQTRTLVWNKGTEISTPGQDFFSTITIDLNDNVYVAYRASGASSGNTYVGPNADIVVAKLASLDGSTQWITQIPTIDNETNPAIVYDTVKANLFVVFNRLNVSTGILEIVIQKLDTTTGALIWEEINGTINGSTTKNKLLSNDSNSTRIISSDNQGNIIFAFYTTGVIPGGTISNFTNSIDIVLMKLNTLGNIQWIKQDSTLNTPDTDYIPSLTSGSSSIYVSYTSAGYVTTASVQPLNGNINWKNDGSSVNPPVGITSTTTNGGTSSVTDMSGNVYVTYYTNGTVSSGTSAGVQDIVLYKMDPSGNIVWVTQTPSSNTSQSEFNSSIALDQAGNVYVTFVPAPSTFVRVSKFDQLTGNFQGNVDIPVPNITALDAFLKPDIIGKSNGFYLSHITGTPRRPILRSYNSSLTELWNYIIPGVYSADSKVSIVAASPNIYLSYSTFGRSSGQSNTGGQDIVIAKIIDNTSSASLSWVRQQPAFNTPQNDYYSKIALDSLQNIYIAYNTDGTTSGATTNPGTQIALVSYDTNGTYRWITQTPLNSIDGSPAFQYPALCILNDELFLSYATFGTVSGGINTQGALDNIVIVKFRMPAVRIGVSSVRVGGSYLTIGDTQLLSSSGVSGLVESPDTFDFADSTNYITWGDILGGNGVSSGSLLRDLGRTIVVVGSRGNHLYKFRKVQLVNGVSTEGVGGSPSDIDAYRCGWICTWSAYGNSTA